jgi:hypothetical protein
VVLEPSVFRMRFDGPLQCVDGPIDIAFLDQRTSMINGILRGAAGEEEERR